MGVALRGNLRDFGISEVFQLIGQQRKTGVLEVEGDAGETIHVAFREGSVSWAVTAGPHEDAALGDMLVRVGMLTGERLAEVESHMDESGLSFRAAVHEVAGLPVPEIDRIEDLVTREAVFRLLRWGEGSFHFHARVVQPRRDDAPELPAEQILMDGLRMVDEWRTLDDTARREETVFQRCARFEAFRDAHPEQSDSARARAERVFLLVDGRTPARRVIDLARTGTFEGARVLSELRRGGVIEPLPEDELARAQPRRAVSERSSLQGRALVAAVLPFALLALLVGAVWMRGPGEAPEPALRVDAMREAQLAFRTLRLRNALDAWRFDHGRSPARPEELVAAGWLGPDALAEPGGEPYHFVRAGGELVPLAPEY